MRRVEFRITSRAPRSCRETPRQSVPPEGQRRGAQSSVVEPGRLGPRDGGGQRLRALGGAEDAVDAVLHDVEHAAAGQGGDRSAARQGLHGRDAEVLLARLQVQRARAVERAQLLGGKTVADLDERRRQRGEAGALGASSHEDESPAEQARGRDRVVEALVGHEGAHGQKEVGTRLGRVGGAEEVDVDRRMQDPRRASVVAVDPRGDRGGVGQVAGGARRGRDVPFPQSRDGGGLQRTQAGPPGRKVEVELLVRVPHRRVAVAEVRHTGRRDRALGDAMRRRDDEVEPGEVERLDGRGKERQEVAVVTPREREAIQPRRPDRVALDRGRDRAGDVEEREDRGLGHERQDRLEDLFAAAHAVQPVVDDGGPAEDGRRKTGDGRRRRDCRHVYRLPSTVSRLPFPSASA